MHHKSTIQDTDEDFSDQVLAYRYRVDVNMHVGFYSRRDFCTLTEYYVPSNKIVFNKLWVYKSEKPNNISTMKFFSQRAEPLTRVLLPKHLILLIEKTMQESNSPEKVSRALEDNEEYQSLFKTEIPKTMLQGNEIVKVKDGFDEEFKKKGNNVLKKILIKYILEGTIPIDTTKKKLILSATALNEVEKDSLVEAIEITLSLENGKLSKSRLNAIREIEKQHENWEVINSGILGGVSGAVISAISGLHPIFTIGLGFFSGTALKYADGQYKQSYENRLWDQRENRANMILDAINNANPSLEPHKEENNQIPYNY